MVMVLQGYGRQVQNLGKPKAVASIGGTVVSYSLEMMPAGLDVIVTIKSKLMKMLL